MSDDRHFELSPDISALVADVSKLDRVHSGPRHKLYRGGASGCPIVVKVNASERPRPVDIASLHHEHALLGALELPGVVRLIGLAERENGPALLLQDAGDTNLAALVRSRPLSIAEVLNIGVQLADAVSELHGALIVHRDIHPGNIVWNSTTGVATLCDFAIARTFPALAMESAAIGPLEGKLPYMSPEQTGRTARPVDARADLYSLGATFYEMLTGSTPFIERDAVALAHAQLARQARPPHELNPQVPPALSHIVLKLLEKEPERRYQSANALRHDLREAQERWLRSGVIETFPLGSHEIPRGLNIPDELYGRDDEQQSLADAFARTCAGGRELVLVTGAPGIGKSALVEHLRPTVGARRGYYAAGKFDQLQRSVPFSGLAQALRSLVRQLLTESESDLAQWREQIEEAAAPNGQLLVGIVPELASILGPQPPVLEVGPVEARN